MARHLLRSIRSPTMARRLGRSSYQARLWASHLAPLNRRALALMLPLQLPSPRHQLPWLRRLSAAAATRADDARRIRALRETLAAAPARGFHRVTFTTGHDLGAALDAAGAAGAAQAPLVAAAPALAPAPRPPVAPRAAPSAPAQAGSRLLSLRHPGTAAADCDGCGLVNDEALICSCCAVGLHADCGGFSGAAGSAGDWFCAPCAAESCSVRAPNDGHLCAVQRTPCVVCPGLGGALLAVAGSGGAAFVHAACVLMLDPLSLDGRGAVVGVPAALAARSAITAADKQGSRRACDVCNGANGALAYCTANDTCLVSVHPMCAADDAAALATRYAAVAAAQAARRRPPVSDARGASWWVGLDSSGELACYCPQHSISSTGMLRDWTPLCPALVAWAPASAPLWAAAAAPVPAPALAPRGPPLADLHGSVGGGSGGGARAPPASSDWSPPREHAPPPAERAALADGSRPRRGGHRTCSRAGCSNTNTGLWWVDGVSYTAAGLASRSDSATLYALCERCN